MDINYCDPATFSVLLGLRRDQKIGWRAVSLGMVIANFVSQDTGEAWPSRATLSAITGIDKADISNTARELRDAGFLTVEERQGRPTVYRLTHRRFATGGDLPPVGDLPPTRRRNTPKPVGDLPPNVITNNKGTIYDPRDDEKTPSGEPTDSGKLESNPLAQGTATPSPAPSPATGSKVKATATKVVWDGTRLIVPDSFLAALAEAYPHVDAPAAIKRASIWVLANPSKRKQNYEKFLNNWFGRVNPGDREYIDPDEQAEIDAVLIRDAMSSFPDPDERADYFWARKEKGLRVPPGVECRPMPGERSVV